MSRTPLHCLVLLVVLLVGLLVTDLAVTRRLQRALGRDPAAAGVGGWSLWATPYVLLATLFYVFSLPYASPAFHYNIDYDAYLTLAHSISHDGHLVLSGPRIVPTDLHLGPLYLYLLAGAEALTGGHLIATWTVLISLNLLGILLFYHTLARLGGGPRAFLATALLLSCPHLYYEQQFLFWHNQYALLFVMMVICGLLRFHALGEVRWWYVALVGIGLAAQMHATALLLWVPLGVIAILQRRLLSRRVCGISLLVLAGLHAYWIAQWSELLHLGRSLRQMSSGHGAASFDRGWGSFAQLVGGFSSASVIVVVFGVGLAAWIAWAWRRRPERRFQHGVAVLALSGTVSSILLFVWIRERWFPEYAFIMIPFVVLVLTLVIEVGATLLDVGTRRAGLAARHHLLLGVRGGAWAVLLLFVSTSGAAILEWGPERGYFQVQSYQRLARAVSSLRREHGVPTSVIQSHPPKLHGFLCTIDGNPFCTVRYLLQREERTVGRRRTPAGGLGARHHNLFFSTSRVEVEAYEPCVKLAIDRATAPVSKAHRTLVARLRCQGTDPRPRYLNVVLDRSQEPGGQESPPRPILTVNGAALPLAQLFPYGTKSSTYAIYRSVQSIDLETVRSLELQIPGRTRLRDTFESKHAYTHTSYGLDRVP